MVLSAGLAEASSDEDQVHDVDYSVVVEICCRVVACLSDDFAESTSDCCQVDNVHFAVAAYITLELLYESEWIGGNIVADYELPGNRYCPAEDRVVALRNNTGGRSVARVPT